MAMSLTRFLASLAAAYATEQTPRAKKLLAIEKESP
jgi:hypothetical protein